MFRPSVLIITIASLCLLGACHGRQGKTASRGEDGPGAAWLNAPSRDADDSARFLAGLPGREGSTYKALESDRAWVRHASEMNDLWERFDKVRKPAMRKFAQRELKDETIDKRVIFYPFSGADALTMLTFFPEHSTFVMAALEPPGLVPKPADFQAGELGNELPEIAGTLQSLLQKSFFVTKEMDRQLRGQVTDGVTDPILILLARSGYQIIGHTYVQLSDAGRITARVPGPQRSAFGLNRGIALEIESPAGKRSVLIYLSLNLDDRHMKDNRAFRSYIASLGPIVTMLKATSYMLHSPQFTRIRDLVLQRSGLIVQDDSGIPWRFLTSGSWQVQLYGDYVHPYGESFKFRTQPDLREAYEAHKDTVKPLEFRLGYGAGRVTSNLQVARRRG